MSKAVLISIQPKWCEKIARGEKTIEVRKNRPKIETTFKCYIYCTASGITAAERDRNIFTDLRCKVIGEFVCDSIQCFGVPYPAFQNKMDKSILEQSCLSYEELHRYAYHDTLYGWHISDLVIYDKPKELGEFYKVCPSYGADFGVCWECENAVGEECDCGVNGRIYLSRPPQSWCYVEEVHGDG